MSMLIFVFVVGILGFVGLIFLYLGSMKSKVHPSLLTIYQDVNERVRAWNEILKPSQMEALLKYVVKPESGKSCRFEENVPVGNILAEEWDQNRLKTAFEGIRNNCVPPRIKVVRYWLHGEAWYVVDDGNHRTIAARLAGLETIQALIIGEYKCSPELLHLDMRTHILWRLTQLDDVYFKPVKIKTNLSASEENVLLDIGVQKAPDDSILWLNIRKANKGIWH